MNRIRLVIAVGALALLVIREERFLQVRTELAVQLRLPELLQREPGHGSALDSAKRLAQVRVVRVREQPVERAIGDPHSREHCRRSALAVRLRQQPRQRRQPCKHARGTVGVEDER